MVQPSSSPSNTLRVPPQRSSWTPIDHWLTSLASHHHLPEPCTYALRLALEELFLNTLSYGCNPSHGTFIQLSFQLHNHHAIIVMEDDAQPFNPLTAPLPSPDHGPRQREGGLGLLLTRQLLTTLDYQPLPSGNRLTLKKQLGQSTP